MKGAGGGGGGAGVGIGGGHHHGGAGKWRWRCLAVCVLFLVILSMLVPLVFLLGLSNSFYSSTTGYVSDQRSYTSPQRDQSSHVSDIVNRWAPTLPKDVVWNFATKEENTSTDIGHEPDRKEQTGEQVAPSPVLRPIRNSKIKEAGSKVDVKEHKTHEDQGSEEFCELKYGSYCLWSEEHREIMKDSMVMKLKDRLYVARAYYPTIAKLPDQSNLSNEMRQNIQELERVLSESTTDADLPPQIEKKLQNMEASIAKAKTFPVDCNNVDKKLRQILDLSEDEANFHMRQSAFLYQLVVQTMPKSLHCLSMRLTVECFKSSLFNKELYLSEKYSDPTLHHYAIFSRTVLAASVVINSTVSNAKESGNLVFHVLTDEQNYFAMKQWFFRKTFKEASIQVLNIEKLNLDYHDQASLITMTLPVEFRASFHSFDNTREAHLTTEYVSVFSDAHYLLPYIFKNLKRVIVLDDDIIVQRDLSDLWNLNMGGKVNGAVKLCSVRLGHLNNYLGGANFDKNSCAWMSGLNVIDLLRWREIDITSTYQKLRQAVAKRMKPTEVVALSASLLAFQDQIYPLDTEWALPGLGHDYGIDAQVIRNAAVLHYNGRMKPWLELGIPKYKQYWKRYLNREDQFLVDCNVNP